MISHIYISYIIIGITAIFSFMGFSNQSLSAKTIFYPAIIKEDKSQAYRFLTSGFLHADFGHLFFNMFSFYFFGPYVESYFLRYFGTVLGAVLFVFFYLSAIVVSSIPDYIQQQNNPRFRSLGASGAVAAVIFAFVLLAPTEKIYLYFAIGIPAFIFAALYLAYSAFMAKRNMDHIGHLAHFAGSIYGLLFLVLTNPKLIPYFIDQVTQFIS